MFFEGKLLNMRRGGDTILLQIKRNFKRSAVISRQNCCIFNAIAPVKNRFCLANRALNLFLKREII